MTIILDNYTLPKTGHVELNLSFDIVISAEAAKRQVNKWLMEEVSTQLGADTPTLIVGRRTVWRVPAHISFPHAGRFDNVGFVEVDAATGELLELDNAKKAIINYLEKEVKHHLRSTVTSTHGLP